MATEMGFPGLAQPGDGGGQYGALLFLVRSVLLKEIRSIDVVRVVAVTNDGGLAPVGFVDVQPLVNQVDGNGNATPHGVLHNLPYFRIQGGTDAMILDPKVGDIGMAGFASRDVSAVKATKDQANPGSNRSFDMADGLYFGGFLNGTPVQYVQFTEGGINIVSPNKVTVVAPAVEVDASDTITYSSPLITLNGTVAQGNGSFGGTTSWKGNMHIIGDVDIDGVLKNNGVPVGSTHTHHENGAGGNTNPPNP